MMMIQWDRIRVSLATISIRIALSIVGAVHGLFIGEEKQPLVIRNASFGFSRHKGRLRSAVSWKLEQSKNPVLVGIWVNVTCIIV